MKFRNFVCAFLCCRWCVCDWARKDPCPRGICNVSNKNDWPVHSSGSWDFWRSHFFKRPKPPRGYNVGDYQNSSRNFFDPALDDTKLTNPDAHDSWESIYWYDFMHMRSTRARATTSGILPLLLVDALHRNPWIDPLAKYVLLDWQRNWTDRPVNQLQIDLYSVDVCAQQSTCDQFASVKIFLQAAFAGQIRTGMPMFQIVIMGEKNIDVLLGAAMQAGFPVTGFGGDSAIFAKDKILYQNFARVNKNRFSIYLSACSLIKQFEFTLFAVWFCDNPTRRAIVDGLGVEISHLKLNAMISLSIENGPDEMNEPTSEWIISYFVELPAIFEQHAHAYFGEPGFHDDCRAFTYFHWAYPWVSGKGFLWFSVDLQFQRQYLYKYLRSLRDSQMHKRSSRRLLAKGVPLDGFIELKDYNSTSFERFNSWVEAGVLPALSGLQASNLVDAFWATALHASRTYTWQDNFTSTNFSRYLKSEIGFAGMRGSVSFNLYTGDRFDDRSVQMILREEKDCKERNQTRCRELQFCLEFKNNRSECENNFKTMWMYCMSDQPDWNGMLKEHGIGVSVGGRLDMSGGNRGIYNPGKADNQVVDTSIVLQSQSQKNSPSVGFSSLNWITRFHNCATKIPTRSDADLGEKPGCIPGVYYDPNLEECIPCARGQGSLNMFDVQRRCKNCEKGRYSSTAGSDRCSLCPKGRFAAGSRTSQCVFCDRGEFNGQEGRDSCENCSPGTYMNETGQDTCKQCDPGFYQNETRATGCIKCRGNYETEFSGSDSLSDCECAEGSIPNEDDTKCVLCSDLYGLLNGVEPVRCVKEVAILQPDFMTLEGSTIVYFCNGATLVCQGGEPVKSESCRHGSSGIACGFCENEGGNSRSRSSDGTCTDCEANAALPFVIIVVVGVFGLILKLRPKSIGYSHLFVIKELEAMFLVLPMVQFTEFAQLCSIFSRSSVSWPSSNKATFAGVGRIFDLSFVNLPCLLGGSDENSASRRVLFLNLSPLILIIAILGICLPSACSPVIARNRFAPNMYVGVNTILTLMQTFFITILNFSLTMVFTAYKHPVGGGESLVVFPYLLTSDGQVSTMKVIANLALAVWCVGTFAFFACTVCLRTFCPSWVVFQRCTFAVAIKYNAFSNAWVLEDMGVKFMSCMVCVLWDAPSQQMQVMGCLLGTHSALVAFVQPYRFCRHLLNDIVQSISKGAVVICSAAAISGDNSDGRATLFVIGVNACIVFCIVSTILYSSFISNRRSPHDDTMTMKWLVSTLASFLPKQPPLFECIGDANSHVELFQTSVEIYERLLKSKQTMEEGDDAMLMKCMPKEHQVLYTDLRQLHRECLVSMASSKASEAKDKLEQQKRIINSFLEPQQ